ncbi:MAG: hypothetical protein ACREFZ_10100 [Acetobacteraceae bacterium]
MRRVLPLLAVVLALIAATGNAHADCAQEIAAVRAHLAGLDQAKQRELELLLAKAQDDDNAGRAKLCADDLRHAEQLVK